MDIVELLEKSANLVFCIAPFNKIVVDLGVLALHKGMWRLPLVDVLHFNIGELWQRPVSQWSLAWGHRCAGMTTPRRRAEPLKTRCGIIH